jgi:hypothetical protein
MKSHGLLFSAPMATANVEDRKTQTRRVITFPIVNADGQWADPDNAFLDRGYEKPEWGGCACLKMPYGPEWSDLHTIQRIFPKWQPGDTIYQKENFSWFGDSSTIQPPPAKRQTQIQYAADDSCRWLEIPDGEDVPEPSFRRVPSIFMRKWSSRFTATITQVRVQRLQEITEEDAEAEGIKPIVEVEPFPAWQSTAPDTVAKVKSLDYIKSYRSLWNSINLAPKPILGPRDEATRKRPILAYISHPWSIEDFHLFLSSIKNPPSTIHNHQSPTWHNKPLHIFPNPWLHAITYQRTP